ncbi:MAG: VOC family protein [Candidatus Dojkabacteria bacterium]
MSKNNQTDLIEFPAKSPEELKAITTFFSKVFGWNFKEYGTEYSDTQGSGLTFGVNASENNKQSMPLAVIYAENLEETKANVIDAGGKIIADIYSFPGGRRFHFTDPAQNEFAVWGK